MALTFKLPERDSKRTVVNKAHSSDSQISEVFNEARKEIKEAIRSFEDEYGKKK